MFDMAPKIKTFFKYLFALAKLKERFAQVIPPTFLLVKSDSWVYLSIEFNQCHFFMERGRLYIRNNTKYDLEFTNLLCF